MSLISVNAGSTRAGMARAQALITLLYVTTSGVGPVVSICSSTSIASPTSAGVASAQALMYALNGYRPA